LLEVHKLEVYEMVKGTNVLGPNFERLNEMVTEAESYGM
jgi:hypothetical protein